MSFLRLVLFLQICLNVEGRGFFSSSPASTYSDVIREAYLVGNGRLGGMPFAPLAGVEKVSLNVDSLWSGGPFQSSEYTGGNPNSSESHFLPGIREWIFQNGTGNVSGLLGTEDFYGSFQVLGNLSIVIGGVSSASGYNRSLDFDTGIHTTIYKANDANTYTNTLYCSFPDQVCVYQLSSTSSLPNITVSLENLEVDQTFQNLSCDQSFVRLTGYTQLGPPLGMKYDSIARIVGSPKTVCTETAGALIIPSSDISTVTIVIGAGTNYDQTKGNRANNFSFKGADPAEFVERVTESAAAKSSDSLRSAHTKDYQSLSSLFTLDLPDPEGSAGLETSTIIDRYNSSGSGDPYVESLLFAYGRHLFISSSRANSLPPNLAGRWSETLEAAWSADYHANINLQMNHWGVDQTGLGDLQVALWNYLENTWVPRGIETARLLYNAPGFVAHDEINIFGHTGMKDTAQWANYPASPAWMMQHVVDHYEYSQNTTWFKDQGYPLLSGVARFWLSQLQPDQYFDDGTLVVNPCNSPEHGPTTFACTHYQQLLHHVFDSIISYASVAEETDTQFLSDVKAALTTLDKGLHIGSWGEIKEWKIPDFFGYDFENDTHRHLSHLVGWYPGSSISSFLGGYSNSTIQDAVATSLWSRGHGNGPDANAGWEKVWRSACWARLNQTDQAYFELKYAVDMNFAVNGLSMYSASDRPFQIDANFGIVGAILSMLVVDLQISSQDTGTHTVVLGPAIPSNWAGGSVKGLRLRYGGVVDFDWDDNGVVTRVNLTGRTRTLLLLNKDGEVLAQQ